jgi:membrane protein required for colicin V production
MNSFDAALMLGLMIAVIAGFKAGLLRSVATMLAYLIALPITIWLTPLVSRVVDGRSVLPLQHSLLFFAVYLMAGVVLGKLMRMALDDAIGPEAGLADRLAGATLGAARAGLVAITLVLVFDQLVPPDRQPATLVSSQLRPLLSQAGQRGFRSLPPELAAAIDRLKKEQRI